MPARINRRFGRRVRHPAPGINIDITAGDILADLMWPASPHFDVSER